MVECSMESFRSVQMIAEINIKRYVNKYRQMNCNLCVYSNNVIPLFQSDDATVCVNSILALGLLKNIYMQCFHYESQQNLFLDLLCSLCAHDVCVALYVNEEVRFLSVFSMHR